MVKNNPNFIPGHIMRMSLTLLYLVQNAYPFLNIALCILESSKPSGHASPLFYEIRQPAGSHKGKLCNN